MINAVPHKQQNELVADLDNMFGEAEKPIEHVVICYSDARLFNALSSLNLPGSSMAVLFVPQEKWSFKCQELTAAIDWILEHEEVKHLSVVGTSAQSPALSGSRLCSTEPTSHGFAKLLAGVQRHNLQSTQNQENFVSNLEHLKELPLVESRLAANDVTLQGFFYRDEYGMFLRYAVDSESIRLC